MKEIFENYVEHAFGAREQTLCKFEQFEFNYRKYFPSPPHGKDVRLLDIGIGRGEMLSCMRDWGYRDFLGIDISPSTVEFCKSLNLPCERVDDTTAWLSGNSETFDVITLLDVLEHIPKTDMIEFLSRLKDALKPAGLLIVQVPNLQAPDGHLHRYNDITHGTGFIEHSLAQVLLAAGFSKFKFIGFEEFVFGTPREHFNKIFRRLHWAIVRFLRRVDGNLNPKILNPVFTAIVYKE